MVDVEQIGTWADHHLLVALAYVLNISLEVMHLSQGNLIEKINPDATHKIVVGYNGQNHYDSLINIKEKEKNQQSVSAAVDLLQKMYSESNRQHIGFFSSGNTEEQPQAYSEQTRSFHPKA